VEEAVSDRYVAESLTAGFVSRAETNQDLGAANVVDGLFEIARALDRLAEAVERRAEARP
jgi:hypothetical protein